MRNYVSLSDYVCHIWGEGIFTVYVVENDIKRRRLDVNYDFVGNLVNIDGVEREIREVELNMSNSEFIEIGEKIGLVTF